MGYNGGARDMLCTEQQLLQKQCWWGWVAPVLYYIANAGTRHSTHFMHISITCCTFFDQGFSSRFSHLHGILVLLYIWQLLYLLEEKMTKKPPKQNKNIYLVNWKTFLSWNKKQQMTSEKKLTCSVSFRILECSPFVTASRRLSASLYTYSSDLARNSDKLPNNQPNEILLQLFPTQQRCKSLNHFVDWE